MSNEIGVPIVQGLNVPIFFFKDVPNFVKNVPNFVKNVPNFIMDVPRFPKPISRWETTSNHFPRVFK